MPRAAAVAPAAPQKVNVSVDVPSAQPAEPVEREEKSPTWYWDCLQEVPKEQWGSIYDVMGFRLDPQAGRQAGAKGFLFQVFEPITLAWIKQNYGGGKFRCILQKNSKFFKSHEFDVDGAPKYDLSREVPHGPVGNTNGSDTNALLKDFVSVLREELQRSREANSAPNPATDEAIGLLSRASEKAMDIVAGRANGGANSTAQLADLVNIVKTLLPQPSGGDLQGTLLKALLDKLLTPVDPLAQVTAFLGVLEKIDAIRGGGGDGGGRAKDWRAMLAEGAVQKAPEILKEVREIVQENRHAATERRATAEAIREVEQIRRGGPVTPATQPAATPPVQHGAPAAVPSGPLKTVPIQRGDVNERIHAEPPMSTTADTPAAAPGMTAAESDAVANFMERRIVEMVEDDRDAEDVVDFIEEIDATMNNMLAEFSPEIVTTFLAGRPIIGKATKHPRWPEFLANAQKYIREIRAEDAAIDAASTRVPA